MRRMKDSAGGDLVLAYYSFSLILHVLLHSLQLWEYLPQKTGNVGGFSENSPVNMTSAALGP
ncbi:hypothetical protein CROQUDRAFT_101687 [Cronartium quercuum f. sp. fusiforme G11]|uniref:Uncharacterized protein n=1 Tax=Cronartium quercuum f. sp. fusiforme G11 TaxID=708437 RepID=A0A9P6N564_9BASI|nr:hypothetical protein CROQUDRAFT_101687 [Cronartium quercuum f. sp. fusiforme G11]